MKNNKSGIVIAGSLSPNKKVQDRVRVLSIWGGVSGIKSNRLQRSAKDTCKANNKSSGIIRLIHRGTGGSKVGFIQYMA